MMFPSVVELLANGPACALLHCATRWLDYTVFAWSVQALALRSVLCFAVLQGLPLGFALFALVLCAVNGQLTRSLLAGVLCNYAAQFNSLLRN